MAFVLRTSGGSAVADRALRSNLSFGKDFRCNPFRMYPTIGTGRKLLLICLQYWKDSLPMKTSLRHRQPF